MSGISRNESGAKQIKKGVGSIGGVIDVFEVVFGHTLEEETVAVATGAGVDELVVAVFAKDV
jgi:hypothetical protein